MPAYKTKEAQNAAYRRWKAKDPERFAANHKKRNKIWRDAHPGYEAQRKYGLTFEQYNILVAKQKGLCAICGLAKQLCIDHNHETNHTRGLLCRGCNASIGQLGDTVERLRAALRYLQNHSSRADWPRVMLDIAMAVASRSRDASTKVGAVVCSADWRVLGTGYNGPPAGSPESLPMAGPQKHNWVIHAEVNAFSQAIATKSDNNLHGSLLFSTHRPCENCLKLASHYGIRELFFDLDELSAEQIVQAEDMALTLGLRVTKLGREPLTHPERQDK